MRWPQKGDTFLVTPDKVQASYLAKVSFVGPDFLRVDKVWTHPAHTGPGNREGDVMVLTSGDMAELLETEHALLDYAFDPRTGDLIDPGWVSGIIISHKREN